MLGDAVFAPTRAIEGSLPIADFGLIGDGSTTALVGRDGSVAWLCAPNFNDEPWFHSILDRRGGPLALGMTGLRSVSRRRAVPMLQPGQRLESMLSRGAQVV